MNKDTFEGKWNELKGKAKEKWGKLTDDDLLTVEGKKDQLVGKLQEKYGYAKDKAETEIASWEKGCGSCGCSSSERDSHKRSSH